MSGPSLLLGFMSSSPFVIIFASVSPSVYTGVEGIEEEKMETLALTLPEVNTKDLFKYIANSLAVVKVKTLAINLATCRPKRKSIYCLTH